MFLLLRLVLLSQSLKRNNPRWSSASGGLQSSLLCHENTASLTPQWSPAVFLFHHWLDSWANHSKKAPNQASPASPCFTTGVSVLFFFILAVTGIKSRRRRSVHHQPHTVVVIVSLRHLNLHVELSSVTRLKLHVFVSPAVAVVGSNFAVVVMLQIRREENRTIPMAGFHSFSQQVLDVSAIYSFDPKTIEFTERSTRINPGLSKLCNLTQRIFQNCNIGPRVFVFFYFCPCMFLICKYILSNWPQTSKCDFQPLWYANAT